MIEIKVVEKDDDTSEIKGRITGDKSLLVDQFTAVFDILYSTDEKLFTHALVRSEFGDMVSKLGTDELE